MRSGVSVLASKVKLAMTGGGIMNYTLLLRSYGFDQQSLFGLSMSLSTNGFHS